MEFRLKADATFEAEGIDDALKKLGKHFLATFKDGLDTPDIFESGEIEIYPMNQGKKSKDSFVEVLAPEV